MNGANHAATALILKKRYPEAPIFLLLSGTVLTDLLWCVFVFAGIELVSYDPVVQSLANIHFTFMPYSHSLISMVITGIGGCLIVYGVWGGRYLVTGVGIALISHVILDIGVHNHDIAISWSADSRKLGSGLYSVPIAAYVVELIYMAVCWYFSGSNRKLLVALIALNLVAITLYVPAITGPEAWFTTYPMLFPVMVLADSLLAIVVLWYFYTHD